MNTGILLRNAGGFFFLEVLHTRAGGLLSRGERSKAAGGNRKTGDSPRSPPLALLELRERLFCLAALVAEDSFEFPLNAEGILCKVAALFLCLSVDSRMRLVRTECGRRDRSFFATIRLCSKGTNLDRGCTDDSKGPRAATLRRLFSASSGNSKKAFATRAAPLCSRVPLSPRPRTGSGGKPAFGFPPGALWYFLAREKVHPPGG